MWQISSALVALTSLFHSPAIDQQTTPVRLPPRFRECSSQQSLFQNPIDSYFNSGSYNDSLDQAFYSGFSNYSNPFNSFASDPFPLIEIAIVDDIVNITGVDAIVNPANAWLEGPWGGLNAVIWHAAGVEKLRKRMRVIKKRFKYGMLQLGQAVLTSSYNIGQSGEGRAKYIVHTVGPDLHTGISMAHATRLLHKCYQNSLDTLVNHGLNSIV